MEKKLNKIIDISAWTGKNEVLLDTDGQEVQITARIEVAEGEKHELDLHIIHRAPNTTAHIDLRGAVHARGRLSLHGTLVVEKTAHKTQSFLKERVLLLDPTATAEAIPNLQIQTDDVSCSHASTISQPDEEQVFYLMSRGMRRKKATEVMVEAFLGET